MRGEKRVTTYMVEDGLMSVELQSDTIAQES